jgi:hypothetical protein
MMAHRQLRNRLATNREGRSMTKIVPGLSAAAFGLLVSASAVAVAAAFGPALGVALVCGAMAPMLAAL